MEKGTVRSMNLDKYFGFIKSSNGGADCFFHSSGTEQWEEMASMWRQGTKIEVEFERTTNPKGPRAENVCLVE